MVEPIENPSVEEVTRWHRTFAPRFFNHTWELMDRTELTTDEVDEMLSTAFAQRAHWYQVGDARNRAIADWQVSRAAVRAGFPNLARRFAERSLRSAADLDPFVVGFAHEAIARAASLVDDVETFQRHVESARVLLPHIEDEEDRAVLEADLDEMTGED
ncbi:MAG TPA: hypothetical protein VHL52_08265 [Acidimicrobiia bacterium]|nr:hypothetical protein [Acidimicrobiia bacterium]